MKTRWRIDQFSAVLFFSLVAASACEPVDDGASRIRIVLDGPLTDSVLPGDRPVYTNIDETSTAASPCEKTTADAHAILKAQCASCHDTATRRRSGPRDACGGSGAPVFETILDDQQLMATDCTQCDQPGTKLLTRGNPMESAIYLRAAIRRDMPPIAACLEAPILPRVSFSAASVLGYWIENCL